MLVSLTGASRRIPLSCPPSDIFYISPTWENTPNIFKSYIGMYCIISHNKYKSNCIKAYIWATHEMRSRLINN